MVLLGFGLAVIAFFLFILLGQLTGGGHGPTLGGQQIVVASQDIPYRTTLSRSDLQLKSFSSSDVPPGSFSSIDDITKGNLVAEINIKQGQPITNNMVADSGSTWIGIQPAYLPIPQGYVAETINTSEIKGVGGYVQVGDYIAVEASVDCKEVQTNCTLDGGLVKPVFTNVHVIRVGPATSAAAAATGTGSQSGAQSVTTGGQPGGVTSSLTIVMTRCDADYFLWFQNNWSVTYYLENYKDYASEPKGPDATCPLGEDHGISFKQVDSRYHILSILQG